MFRSTIAFCMMLGLMLLGGCKLGNIASAASRPPPTAAVLAPTIADDKAVVFAFEAFDVYLDLVDRRVAEGRLRPGSDEARRVAAAIRDVKNALNAASQAQRAGQAASYAEAFGRAATALAHARALVK